MGFGAIVIPSMAFKAAEAAAVVVLWGVATTNC